ncbi:hypothetical protein NKI31_25260, partial [Mesorhizobium sp. M0659]|uniref:hypothetical protein n=1 Tax=Mesorhizobium sp. M0659 TaxID=2956980 RepID=UPI003336DB29
MELGEAREVRTTCPYCGVGCGVLAKVAPGGGVSGPRAPPPTPHIGRRRSKGAAPGATNPRAGTRVKPP